MKFSKKIFKANDDGKLKFTYDRACKFLEIANMNSYKTIKDAEKKEIFDIILGSKDKEENLEIDSINSNFGSETQTERVLKLRKAIAKLFEIININEIESEDPDLVQNIKDKIMISNNE